MLSLMVLYYDLRLLWLWTDRLEVSKTTAQRASAATEWTPPPSHQMALLIHISKVTGSSSSQVLCACSLSDCVGFLWVLQLPPTDQRHIWENH